MAIAALGTDRFNQRIHALGAELLRRESKSDAMIRARRAVQTVFLGPPQATESSLISGKVHSMTSSTGFVESGGVSVVRACGDGADSAASGGANSSCAHSADIGSCGDVSAMIRERV